jgi:hypothetical protein
MVDLALLQSVSYIAGALGVCVAAVYYVMNLRISQRNQELSLKAQETSAKAQELALKTQQQTLETRQAQMFMSIYSQTTTKDFTQAWNKVASYEWKNFEEYQTLYQKKEFRDAYTIIGMYFEGLGVLVRKGYLDISLIALLMCGMTTFYWEKFIPIKNDAKVEFGFSRWMSETEYLYDELLKYLKVHPELDTRIKKLWIKPAQ